MTRTGWGRHTTVATGVDSGDQVSVNAWNADLSTSGVLGFTKQAGSISANAITPTGSVIEVQATGTLNTLTPTDNNEFDLIYLIAASGATVTVTHDATGGAGKIRLLAGVNKTLSTTSPTILMCRTISGNKEWIEYGGGITNALDDIGDVTITSPVDTQVLTYSGGIWINEYPSIVGNYAKNTSGAPIAKGKAVYVTGYDVGTGYPEIALADNTSSTTMAALGITNQSISNNATGFVVRTGQISGLNTNGLTVNATLYVGTSGDLTTTKPTGTALIQNVGRVLRAHSSAGVIQTTSIGRTNDLPNIPNGQTWIGNASGVPTPTTLAASATTDATNADNITSGTLSASRLGVTAGTVSASKPVVVDASKNISGFNDVSIAGNLTVAGTTTTLDTQTLQVKDKNIDIGYVASPSSPSNTTADGGGISLLAGVDGNKTIVWDLANNNWTSSENWNIATGKTFKINNTTVLSNNTLGSGVTASSLTSVGTIGTGTWQGSIIGGTYGGTGVNNGSSTITLGGNLTTSGAFPLTLTTTASTNVTLPTSGTLVNSAVTSLSSLATVGTITSGTWNGTTIGPAYGGTGLTSFTTGDIIYANGSNTLTKLAAGTNGYVLTLASGVPTWAAAAGGGATIVHTFSNTTTTTYTGTATNFTTVGVGDRDIYIKKIDANNEGVFTKIWKNGAAVEVQIA